MTKFEKGLTNKGEKVKLERGNVLFKDNTEGRVYNKKSKSKENIENQYPSTTTIIDNIKNLKEEEKLKNWKDRVYKPKDLLNWYQARGILTHEFTYAKLFKKLNINYNKDQEEINRALNKLDNLKRDFIKNNDLSKKEILNNMNIGPKYSKLPTYYLYALYSANICSNNLAQMIYEDCEELILTEKYLIDEKNKWAGQLDLLYLNKENELCVTDIKTSSGIRNKYQYQITAYYKALPIKKIINKYEKEYEKEKNINININYVNLQIARCNIDGEQSEIQLYKDNNFKLSRKQAFKRFKKQLKKFRKEKLPVKKYKY